MSTDLTTKPRTISVPVYWETKDGKGFLSFERLRSEPGLRKQVKDQRGFRKALKKWLVAHGADFV